MIERKVEQAHNESTEERCCNKSGVLAADQLGQPQLKRAMQHTKVAPAASGVGCGQAQAHEGWDYIEFTC